MVVSDKTPDAFFEWAFEQGGRNPLAWEQSANEWLEAADAVKVRVQRDDTSVQSVSSRFSYDSTHLPGLPSATSVSAATVCF